MVDLECIKRRLNVRYIVILCRITRDTEYLKDSIGESVRGGKAKRFIPPTVEEVESYCSERGNGIDAQSFIDFYESKGWMIGKNKMKDWKAAVRTWERSRNKNSTEKSKTVFDEWRES